jgi:hypothetical protein
MALNGILLIASSASAGGEAGYTANGKKKRGGCYKRDERKEVDFSGRTSWQRGPDLEIINWA